MTHLTEKDLVTVGSVGVHRVYVIPESDGGRGVVGVGVGGGVEDEREEGR